ncbi:MAG: hypothetical protein AAFY82_00110 [Pseudomonadota bacterium]
MQLAMAVGTKLFAGASAAKAGIGAAVGAGKGILGGISAGKVSAGASALSALSTLAGANARANAEQEAALEARASATQAQIQGVQEGNEILDRAIGDMARRRVAYSAAGVDPDTGSARSQLMRQDRDLERDLQVTQGDALASYLTRRRSARNLMKRARASRTSGLIGASAKLAEGAADLMERG